MKKFFTLNAITASEVKQIAGWAGYNEARISNIGKTYAVHITMPTDDASANELRKAMGKNFTGFDFLSLVEATGLVIIESTISTRNGIGK